ncbi:CHASE2 domain-containing protein [Leptolyngbya sp. CCY15150]|uniref:CHASE2 domain-containing protein n=1 Tax=Leptolyngbya sp. CCY15150 TaxID=2767772 RepID=UPI0019509A50|nr:CHASE2 domain-containing protein [Leptolyngbya sp. CCY15150]
MRDFPLLFQLTVQQVDATCTFQLTWGGGQRLHAQQPMPPDLMRLYWDWQRAYLNFYRSLPKSDLQNEPEQPLPDDALRGRLITKGAGTSTATDWQADLADLQQRLQLELHRWLHSPALYTIRQEVLKAAHTAEKQNAIVDLLITCHPLDLARLPWETWELGADSGIAAHLRLARAPFTIQSAMPAIAPKRRRPRILMILGDDRGLNFQREKEAIAALRTLAEVVFIGWEPGKSVTQVKEVIQTALMDSKGWDALFFAGHSNEKTSMGGELGIAPHGYLRIAEMKAPLAIAKQHGLQFALFNSCNGLNLAESLIDLGLSQVVIMREPIHNSVAEAFIVRFAQALAQHKDVQECLQDACHALKIQKALTYPAADLVPSLFRYPHTQLFRIPPTGWREWLAALTPNRWEAIALLILLILTWQLPVQKWLIERRVLLQAFYQDLPWQPTPPDPPTLLLQIDEAALRDQKRFRPIPRDYLAQLVDQAAGTPVIGIDYLLDLRDDDDPLLAQSFAAAAQQGSFLVLGASREQNTRQWRYAQDSLRHPDWSISGSMTTRGTLYAELLSQEPWPLSYLLAALHHHCDAPPCTLPTDLPQSPRFRASWLTRFSYGLGQMWLHPIIDYSLPPDQVYDTLSSQRALDTVFPSPGAAQILMIVPNYAAAGIERENEDNFLAPAAYRYWHRGEQRILTGGEYHAYLLYQYLNHRMVIPIPDVWMMILAAVVGKGVRLILPTDRRSALLHLSGGTFLYSFASLALYASSAAIALPILTPSLVVWLIALRPTSRT